MSYESPSDSRYDPAVVAKQEREASKPVVKQPSVTEKLALSTIDSLRGVNPGRNRRAGRLAM